MQQLIAHLVGDYILQTHWMAVNKVKKFYVATIHAFFYSLPFIFLTQNITSLAIIFVTHIFIDRYSIAKHISKLKNCHFADNGYPPETPIWLSTWLIIILDNTLHLIINYIALSL